MVPPKHPDDMRIKPGTLAMTFLLAAMTSLGPLSTDIYVASLPHIGLALGASVVAVQLTLTCYLLGFASAQIVYGPLSDKFGRRPLLLAGYALYISASLACLFATSVEVLIAGRVVQAFGAAGPIILSRAIVRDLFEGRLAARQYGIMSTIMGVTPIVAPIAGGFLQAWFGWRSSFAVMAAFGIALGCVALLLLPETNKQKLEGPLSFRGILESYGIVLQNKAYRAYLGIQACSFNGLFGFISASSHVMQRVYGLSAPQFGYTFTACSMSFVIGTFVGSRMVARRGIDGMIGLGVACELAGGLAQVVALYVAPQSFLSIMIPYMLFFLGVGFLLPQTQAASLTPFPDRAGAASSLMGFIQMTSGAIVGTIVGATLGATAWPLAIVTSLSGILAFAIFHLSAKARRDFAPVTRSFPRP
jgi:DHA1 family bicyclomycin/chloramphenicol resistance-like MFS transporter